LAAAWRAFDGANGCGRINSIRFYLNSPARFRIEGAIMHRGASPEDNAAMSVAVGKKSTARNRVVMRSNK
jgi:hypothetical protein